MGKTAVFVLATLQQIEPVDGQVKKRTLKEKKQKQIDLFEILGISNCSLSYTRISFSNQSGI